ASLPSLTLSQDPCARQTTLSPHHLFQIEDPAAVSLSSQEALLCRSDLSLWMGSPSFLPGWDLAHGRATLQIFAAGRKGTSQSLRTGLLGARHHPSHPRRLVE